jgi:hypothetical protein
MIFVRISTEFFHTKVIISDFDINLFAHFNMDMFRLDRVCTEHVVNRYTLPVTFISKRMVETSHRLLRDATFYQNDLDMTNTADVTGAKPIAI